MTHDLIEISGLEVMAQVGVPDEERAAAQKLEFDIVIFPEKGLAGLNDEIDNTVDYFAVSERVKEISAEKPRKLIETLAEEIAEALLAEFPLALIRVKIRKFILSDTKHVAVEIARPRQTGGAE